MPSVKPWRPKMRNVAKTEASEKWSHFKTEVSDEILKTLNRKNVVAFSLHDLGPADVPVQHSFTLTGEQPIHYAARRMDPKHNQLLREKMDKKLRVGYCNTGDIRLVFPCCDSDQKRR